MTLGIISTPRFAEHTPPPGHAERPERADVLDVVAARWRDAGAIVREPGLATREDLERAHEPGYLEALAATAGHARMLDPDTFTSPESWEIARLAAGAALDATRLVLDGAVPRAAALVRPPGHHATAERAMGFCLLNNVAIAAADALARGVPRVAVVDFDVHHGNGTQAIFEADPRVLYISTHQWPLYPGTGAADEVGVGDGVGTTVNVPLPSGCVDEDYDCVWRALVLPVLSAFDPGLILVSAGFDAHQYDPLAGMRLTGHGFAALTRGLAGVADACCGGRMVLVTEGGYHLQALAASLHASLGAMAGVDVPSGDERPAADPEVSDLARAMLARAVAVQRPFWRGL